MISHHKLQDVGLWEAWIEFDQFTTGHFGILYVLGEIMTDEQSSCALIRKYIHEDGQLVLEVPARPDGRCRMKEVLYSEPVDNLSQYSTICIYAGTELVANFDEIEIMV